MLNQYSPFIQFIAAIYFSMCFEQIVEKFFWNKLHNEKMEKVMQKIEHTFGLTDDYNKEIVKALSDKHDNFVDTVRKWSMGMLLLLIIVLFFSGIEQSFNITIPCYSIIVLSILILLPAIYFFVLGWNKTQRYVKKINRVIDREIDSFYKNAQDSITGNTRNTHYNEMLAEIINNVPDGDKIDKANILAEIMQKFKGDSVLKIKNIICEIK